MRPTTGPTTGPTTRYFVSPRVVFPKVLEPHYSADWAGMNTFYQWPETQKSVDQLAQAYAPLSRFPYERQQHLAKSFKEQAATFEARAKPAPVITNRPADAPPRPQRNLRGATPVAGDPVPVAAAVGPGTLWPDSMVLIDVVSNNNEDTGFSDQQSLAYPLVDAAGKFVYVVQKNATGQSWSLDLLRFDLTNGKGGPFSSFKGDRAASKAPFFNYVESNGISANLTDKYYLLCCKSQIILYPLAGGQPQSIDAKDSRLPAGHFHSAAVMDDVVYCGAGQGFMFAYDLKTGSRRTLASSRRLAGATQPDGDLASVTSSPFDDDAPLFLSYIKADSERKRLIFLISNPAWDDKKSGWWSYEPASGKFTQLAGYHMRSSNTSRDATWARSTSPNRIFFGFPGLSSTVLDLPSDKVTFLPPVPQQMSSGRGRVDVNDVLGKPLLENNGWIWGRFGRYRIVETEKDGRKSKTTELQSFDSLRAGPRQWGNWPPFLAPVDENRIVVGDSKGVWLLKIPADDPVAMSKLIQPPRPMNASVEPVGVPPMGKSLPWSDVRVLYDTIRGVNVGSKVSLMRGPIVWGDDVFVLAAGEGGTILVRYRLSDGTRTELGKANIDLALSARGPAETLAQNDGALFTTDGQFYYTTRDSHIVHAIPLDGGKARSISFRFGKYSWVRELAAVDGKLFVGLTVTEKDQADGSRGEIVTKLVRYDLATSTMEELNIPARATFGIAGRPREPGLKLRLLRADPARHRVVFFVNQHPLTDESIDGLWACDVAGAPARLKPFDIWPRTGVRVGEGVFDKAGPVRGNNWIVVCPNGAILLDLSTLDFQRIWQVEPAGVPLDASFDFRWPMDVAGGYVWDEGFHRAKLDGSVYQALPALWPMDFKNYGINLKLVEARVDQTEMLIADNCGFWILTLRQQGQ